MNIGVSIRGIAGALTRLGSLNAAVGEVSKNEAVVGTNIVYAHAYHFGHGRWKGHPFLHDALETERAAVQGLLAAGLSKVIGGAASSVMTAALRSAGLLVQAESQRTVHVRTGTLRRSMHTEILKR